MVGEVDTLPAAAGVGIPAEVEEVAANRRVAEADTLPAVAEAGRVAVVASLATVGKAVQGCKAL